MSHRSTTPEHGDNSKDWERYTVQSPREILSLLRTIQQQNLLVNLSFAGGEGVITTILAVDAERNLVVFDSARSELMNKRLSTAGQVDFSTSLNGVRISFSVPRAQLVRFDRRPAIMTAVPQEMIRLQRRDNFRVMMPVAKPSYCLIPPQAELYRMHIRAAIIDLSCGGVAIAENEGALDMKIGDILTDCRLLLHEIEPVTVSLEVRNTALLTLHNGIRKTRLGCRFVDLPADLHSLLQRYILKLERELRKR